MKQTILSSKQSELLENLIVKYGQIVTIDQVVSEAKSTWDYKQAKNLITKLTKNGWLIRIKEAFMLSQILVPEDFYASLPIWWPIY